MGSSAVFVLGSVLAIVAVGPVPADAQAPDVEKARAEKKIVSYG